MSIFEEQGVIFFQGKFLGSAESPFSHTLENPVPTDAFAFKEQE